MSRISEVFEIREGMEGIGDILRVAFVVITVLVFCVLSGWYGAACERVTWQEESVKRGHAEYSQTTGQWQWKEAAK